MPVELEDKLTISFGRSGLNSSLNSERIPFGDLLDCDGISFDGDIIRKEGGKKKFNTTPITGSPKIVGLHDFWNGTFTQFVVAGTSDGKLVTVVVGGIGSTLKSSWGGDDPVIFVEGANGSTKLLFAFKKGVNPQSWDGVAGTSSDVATPPADWTTSKPVGAVQHENAIWAWGEGHILYKSKNSNHGDYTVGATSVDGAAISVYPGEGEKIVAALSLPGRLVVWKHPYGVYVIDTTATQQASWTIRRISNKIGMYGALARDMVHNDGVFWGTDGLPHVLSRVQEVGEVAASAILIDKLGPWLRDHTSVAQYKRAAAIYYGRKQELHIALAEGASVNNRRLILNFSDPTRPKASWSTRDVCVSLAIKDDSGIKRIMAGDDAGTVWLLDDGTLSSDGAAYSSYFETHDMLLYPDRKHRANLEYVEIVVKRQTGEFSLDVQLELDRKRTITKTFAIGGGAGFVLDSSALGTGVLGGGDAEVSTLRRKLDGACRRLKVRCSNNIAGQDYAIDRITVGITPGDDRL